MAHAAGVAVLEQNSHLCVHPKYGPWIALRCALVFDGVRYTEPQTVPRMNPLSVSTQQYIQMAMRTALRKPSLNLEDAGQAGHGPVCVLHGACMYQRDKANYLHDLHSVTALLAGHCPSDILQPAVEMRVMHIEYALSLSGMNGPKHLAGCFAETSPKPCNAWLKWVAVRDAICPCHPWRYCEQQLEYHYTKDKSVLESAEARHCQQC